MVPIDFAGDDAHALVLADESCDMALSSFTLCSVEDPGFVLRQVWRVLKPGGQFHFLEHGLAPTFAALPEPAHDRSVAAKSIRVSSHEATA